MIDKSLKERFETKYLKGSKQECWNWTASTAGNGYGQIKLTKKRRQEYAHRVSYLLHHGEIADDLEVCHTCDNPLCVNPSHLFLGTRKDNAQDMKSKFRSTYGEKNARALLTEEDVRRIRNCLKMEMTQKEIAKIFGISQIQVSRINTKKQWSHVK